MFNGQCPMDSVYLNKVSSVDNLVSYIMKLNYIYSGAKLYMFNHYIWLNYPIAYKPYSCFKKVADIYEYGIYIFIYI